MSDGTGRLRGLARKARPHAEPEEADALLIDADDGVIGDWRGRRDGGPMDDRQVTVLAAEAWDAACADIGRHLPWTTRRANLLVEGIDLRDSAGARLSVGEAVLRVTMETVPCFRMDQAFDGLRAALVPDWRGGVCCRVEKGGRVCQGDAVVLDRAPSTKAGSAA